MQFMPIIIIITKLIKLKIVIYYVHSASYFVKLQNTTTLSIDREYSMILNKLEIMIVFSYVSPLLFPLTLTSIKSNIIFYNLLHQRLQ